jgi:MoxR-like ATPase
MDRTSQRMNPTTERILAAAGQIILGKQHQLRLALACILARGHLLIEDLPGMGKTTLSHVLAQVLGLEFRRVQFTSDLLPADILGVSVYDRNEAAFKFHPGPVFTHVLLADEINRATPKTQSALMEVMEERQVTHEGETRPLPEPFFVIATQNPASHIGTFPLPESQLDRFLMRIALGYPDARSERNLLMSRGGREHFGELQPVIDAASLIKLQEMVHDIHISDALLDYLQALLAFTRQSPRLATGLSPRAGLALKHCAQAWALMQGRDYALPEDIQAVFPGVAGHRLHAASARDSGPSLIADVLQAVPVR